jgi:hypothetical protein
MEELTEQKCEACRAEPIGDCGRDQSLQPQVPEWQMITEDGIPKLDRLFKFKNFRTPSPSPTRSAKKRKGRASSSADHRVG